MRAQEHRSMSYLRQVDEAMQRTAGVRFSQIRSDLEAYRGTTPMTEAMAAQVTPAAYADHLRNRFGFKPADSVDAANQNRYIASLVEFAADNPDWIPGSDGSVYAEMAGGVARIRPDYDWTHSKLGFVTGFAEGATLLSRGGIAIPPEGNFEFSGAAIDIGEAVDKLEAPREYRSALRM